MALYSFPSMGAFKSFMFKHDKETDYTVKINIDKNSFAGLAFEGRSVALRYIIRGISDEDITKQDGNDIVFVGSLTDAVTTVNIQANSVEASLPVPMSGICHHVSAKHVEVLLFDGDFVNEIKGVVDVVEGTPYEDIIPVPYSALLNREDDNEVIIDIPDFAFQYKIVPRFTADTIPWPVVTQLSFSDPTIPAERPVNAIVSEDWQEISSFAVALDITYDGDATNPQVGEVYFKVLR